MIDQEGYRVIQPIFRFAGYFSGTADFMPAQRKSFIFHHTALETPPVLRRLMVNGDEYHDYLSRQAYLVLQSNGPYTVQGIEPIHTSRLFSTAEPVLLAWRFDYVVGDRRTDTGRIIPGEKTLTPLSFSCSPTLLWPTQARKIRVVHVVRKSVATKLTATKVEPPTPHPDLAPLYGSDSKSREITSTRHRRVRSHALQSARTHRIPTHDSALTSSVSFHGTNGSFPTQLAINNVE
ncbi:hypothetical protein BGW80DRAFT_1198436 [Lactifluus volemus]|nr:hypothetical protein BGW80DRAFT_1198436 [Lactifluus volemus]